MVAQLAQRVGMSPQDVELATEGRIRAHEVAELTAAEIHEREGEPIGEVSTQTPETLYDSPADAHDQRNQDQAT